MCRPIVYLAGPITHETWDGAMDWRDRARAYLNRHGIATLNPLRTKDFLKDEMDDDKTFSEQNVVSHNKELADSLDTPTPYAGLISSHGITHRDRWDVLRSNLILADFGGAEKVSIGTVMEIAWANTAGIYIVTIMTEHNPHYHGMVIEASSLIVPSLSAALAIIPDLLGRETLQ